MRQFEKIVKENIFSIRPIDDDHPNIFLINFTYIVRATDPIAAEIPFRKNLAEYYFYQEATKRGFHIFSPNIRFYIPRGNIKTEFYLDGPAYQNGISEQEAFKVIDAIASLHHYKLPNVEFDPFAHFYHYKKMTPNALPTSFEDSLIKKMRMIRDSSPLVLSHNDVKARHVVFHDDAAYLLDFKNVGNNAPIFDLASFFLDADLSPDLVRSCMARYQKLAGGRTYLYQEVFDAMSFIAAYDYYHYAALASSSPRLLFKDEAKKRKAKCLALFEETIG